MATQAEFENALNIGIAAENRIYYWLRNNYAYVQDTRYQRHEKGTGPRLEGQLGSLILPDFIVYDRFAGNIAIDVKHKTSVYPIDGKLYFTVDDYKLDDYLTAAQIMRLDSLCLIFYYKDEIYMYNAADVVGRHRFNNSYGKHAYLFEYDRSKIRK